MNRGGVGDIGQECNPFIVWGASSSRGSALFLVCALGGPMSKRAAVQAEVVFPAVFLLNRSDQTRLLALVLAGTGG